MEDFVCCVCQQIPMRQDYSPLLFTCGHYACSGCRVDSNCPVDRCDSVSQDPDIVELYNQLREVQNTEQWQEYPQRVSYLWQRLWEKYPQVCPRCGNRCRPDGCYLCGSRVCPRCNTFTPDLKCEQCGYVDLNNVETVKETQSSQPQEGVPSSSSDPSNLVDLENELNGGKWQCKECLFGQNFSFSQKCSNCNKPRLRFLASCSHAVSGLQYLKCTKCAESGTNLQAKFD